MDKAKMSLSNTVDSPEIILGLHKTQVEAPFEASLSCYFSDSGIAKNTRVSCSLVSPSKRNRYVLCQLTTSNGTGTLPHQQGQYRAPRRHPFATAKVPWNW